MEITYLGQSAFRLRGKDVTVLTDPYPEGKGISMGKPAANIVTLSQGNADEEPLPGVAGSPRVIDGPGEYEIADLLIAGVATASQPSQGPVNTAYIFRFDEAVICHLGNLRTQLTDKQVEEIGNIDVLLIPAGGGGALGPAEAAEVVSQLEPALVIPMRYRLNGVDGDLAPVDLFCREMGQKEITRENRLTVTRNSLPPSTRVVVLENRRV